MLKRPNNPYPASPVVVMGSGAADAIRRNGGERKRKEKIKDANGLLDVVKKSRVLLEKEGEGSRKMAYCLVA